ncbi:MAG: hypothetical protein K2K97_10415 [Muribaculaceae bacterium]|nr:hypothetical protein [Muribaculaceae bacterium]
MNTSGLNREGEIFKQIYWSYVLVLTALFVIMYGVTVFCYEDWWYTANSKGEWGSWEYFITTVANSYDHWQWDTGRLSNMAATPFLALFPKWVYGIFSGVCIAFIYIFGVKITKVGYSSLNSAFWLAVVSFIIPWHDFFFTVIYSINYIWPAAMGLGVLMSFLKNDTSRRRSLLYDGALMVLCIVTGWWHEGLSVPLLCSLGVYQLIEWRKPTLQRWLIALGLMIGICIVLSMPGFWALTEERESMLVKSTLWETAVNAIAYNCMYYLYVVLLLCAVVFHKLRERIFKGRCDWALQGAIFIFGTISTYLYFRYYNGPRTGMYGQLMCALGIMAIARNWNLHPRRWINMSVLTGLFCLAAVSLVVSIKVQLKLSREISEVAAMAKAEEARSGRALVFYDPTPITLGIDFLKPSYQILNTKVGLQGIELFPKALEDFSLHSPEIRYNSDSTLIIFRNRVLLRGAAPEERIDINLTYDNGDKEFSRTRIRDFVTTDGDTVSFVLPHTQAMGSARIISDAHLAN